MAKLQPGTNDLATINPELASEWHPTKNGDLKPTDVTFGSGQKVWWLCKEGHEWPAAIKNRANGNGCPYCAGKLPIIGETDFETTHPDLAKQWHPTENGSLKPIDVTSGSGKKAWWLCPICGYEWASAIKDRTNGHGCPRCSGQVISSEKTLTVIFPELAAEWDYEANKGLKNGHGVDVSTPDKVTYGSSIRAWWKCPVCGHRWKTSIKDRTHGYGCPCCSGRVVAPEKDLLSMFPEIAKQWDYEANNGLRDGHGRDVSAPNKISYGSDVKVWWKCPVCGCKWTASVRSRTKDGNGCPHCNKSKGEKAIRKILKDNHIFFEEQYKFKDRTVFSKKYPLRDDFAIFDNNGNVVGTIEYNGKQHYEVVDFSGHNPARAQKEFEDIQKRDRIKSDYLKARNIPQLIIPYWMFKDIEKILNDFIFNLSSRCDIFMAC